MLMEFNCSFCGADGAKHGAEYDGMLGYEALVCRKCGAMYDMAGSHPPSEEWCKYVGIKYRPYVVIDRDRITDRLDSGKPEDIKRATVLIKNAHIAGGAQ